MKVILRDWTSATGQVRVYVYRSATGSYAAHMTLRALLVGAAKCDSLEEAEAVAERWAADEGLTEITGKKEVFQ